jgi:hypothetical protein
VRRGMEKERTNDQAKKYFDKSISDRERAIFEGGIALGAIYHQFTGIPISSDPKIVEALEKAIKSTMELQPFKERVDIRIRRDRIKKSGKHPYDYDVLKDSMLEAEVTAKYGKTRAVVAMRYIPELDYSLMFVEKVLEEK